MKHTIFTLLFLLLAAQANAATYWVNPASSGQHCTNSASDPGAGSSSQTIAQGLDCAGAAETDNGAGDTVIVKNGTYQEELFRLIPNGTNGSVFTLKAENNRGAIIQATSRGNGAIISMANTVHYVTIDGLVLDGNSIGSGGGLW